MRSSAIATRSLVGIGTHARRLGRAEAGAALTPLLPMMQQPDQDDDDAEREIAANLWRHHRLLPPSSRFKERWDLMILLFVLYNCVAIPMQIAFAISQTIPHLVIDYLIDVAFAVDIAINFRTAFYNEHYEMVMDKRDIAKRYIRESRSSLARGRAHGLQLSGSWCWQGAGAHRAKPESPGRHAQQPR